jgi:Linalool dehydratase/isomerase
MTSSTETSDTQVRYVTRLIPEFPRIAGPVTARLYRRLMMGFGGAWTVGLALVLFAPVGWKSFGVGLFVPGGGFIYTGRPWWAVVAFLVFMVTLFLWLMVSAEIIIVPVWLLTAAVAGATVGDRTWDAALWAIPVSVVGVVLILVGTGRWKFLKRRDLGIERNKELSKVSFPISGRADLDVTESTAADLDVLRYPLDLLLQPIDSYEGFTKIDQIQMASLRYQLYWAQFALATAQFTRTPAFSGYLSEAQRNAIAKVLQPVNWRYWRWEHLWGNGRWNPDPVATMNIMLAGFYGTSVGLYQSVTGDTRYDEPGALTFRDGNREYRYDYRSMSDAIRRNVDESLIGLQPCEPSWIYSICNTFTLNSLGLHQRLHHDTAAAASLQRVIDNYELEFLRPDGHFALLRAKIGPRMPSGPHAYTEGFVVGFGNAMMPEVARRTWWVMSRGLSDPRNVKTYSLDKLDYGNYRIGSDGYSRVAAMVGAREMGDHEVADALVQSLYDNEDVNPTPGGPFFPKMSVLGNLGFAQAHFTRENVWRDMIRFGAPTEWRTGPILAEAAYPAVQVARAVTDGRALDLVLRPGNGGSRTTLGIERLVPGHHYTVRGALNHDVVADAHGKASIDIDLDGRLHVVVDPAS